MKLHCDLDFDQKCLNHTLPMTSKWVEQLKVLQFHDYSYDCRDCLNVIKDFGF